MKTKLLFINHGSSIGGAALSLLSILKKIDRNRCSAIVILPREGPFSDLLREEGIEYRICPLFVFYYCSQAKTRLSPAQLIVLFNRALKNIICLSRILMKENPDRVIINSSTMLICGLIAKTMGKRIIWHIREVISTERSRVLKKIISTIIRFSADRVVVVSEYSRKDMFNLKIKNVSMLYDGGVSLQKFKERKEFPNDKIVGFVGQVYREKGWEVLAKAAFLLVEKFPSVKFIIVGSGYMIDRQCGNFSTPPVFRGEDMVFHQMIKDLKLSDNFIFLGQRFDVEEILPLMTCLVFPSIVPEVFGKVMVEAMACGLPVIASRIGAASEIVIEGVTGLLVDPNNPKALSGALIEILVNPQRAGIMGQAGRKRVEEVFDIDKVIPELMQIYGLP